MTPATADATAQLVLAVATPLLTALAGWLLTKVPGPLRDWLASGTHQRDVQLIVDMMVRRAMATAVPTGEIRAASPVLDLISYTRTHAPDTIQKLAPTDEALRTIALAAIAQSGKAAS